jgi:hypothetical protein
VFGLDAVIEFLELIAPQLIAKKTQAKLLLEYCKSRKIQPYTFKIIENNCGRKVPIRAKLTHNEKNMIRDIRELNSKRGKGSKYSLKYGEI